MDFWQKLDTARVATLATVNPDGSPHLVPVVFARLDERIITSVDGKPKSGVRLRRLANIEANPAVCLLVHHYEEDWGRLWWVRIDGQASVALSDPEAISALRARYPQYGSVDLPGPIISIQVSAVRSWSA